MCVLEREMEKFSAINASQQESVIESFVHGFYNLDWFFFAVLSIFSRSPNRGVMRHGAE